MRVLFVDDEPHILSGIRRTLRSMRGEWQMDFVNNGADAITRLESAQCDVIVSDMQMPGMDGAQLLSRAKEIVPGAIRIALSGQTDQNSIYRCVQHAHQYLAKPCDVNVLVDAVRRACMLQELLQDQRLASRVNEMSSIPSLPEQYDMIMEELQSENASLQNVAKIIESDVAMCAKILQLVNSSFFGLSQHVASPVEATMLLGVDVIRTLVLTSGIFSKFDDSIRDKIDLQSIWSRSTQVGMLARKIAMEETQDKLIADYSCMAGMLIDIGEIVLAANSGDELADAWQAAQQSGEPAWRVEREVLGQSHMEVGAYLVGLWGLPNPIIEAVAYHHAPSAYAVTNFSSLTAVHAAMAIVTASGTPQLDTQHLEQLDLTDRVQAWQQLHEDTAPDK